MNRKIASLWKVIATLIILVHPGFAVDAQGLSFPAEINKSFTPISIPSGGVSRLTVTIYNPNSFPLSNASWTDNLVGVQPGLSIANPPNLLNTCGGDVTAVAGATTLSLSGGDVPAQVGMTPGECTVSIDVTSTTIGNLINTIPANELTSTGGGVSITNTTPASATLTVIPVQPPTVNKSFSPSTVWVGETSVLTITINNNNPVDSLTQASLTDNLPVGVQIADPALPANALQNCGASASLTANPGGTSITLNNATITPSLNCIIRVNVISSIPGQYVNTIPANALTTQQGVTNASPASDQLNVQGVGVEKSFAPPSFQAGGGTTLTITLENPTGNPYTGVSITDELPGTVLTVVPGTAVTTCGGDVSTVLPRTVTLTGGTIPAGSVTNPGTCTITVQVTAPADATTATFTNTIPVNSLVTNQGVTNTLPASANVQVYTAGQGITANKAFSPDTINVGDNSRLRFNFTAPADTALTNFSFTDNLPAGVIISNSLGPTISSGCGATASLTAITGTSVITLTNATINPGALCRVQVWVTSSTPGTVTNTMPPENITNDQDQVPPNPLTDDLTVLALSDLSVSKAFAPSTVSPNGISTLTITLQNTNTSPLINVTVTDNLPGTNANNTVRVAPVPNASTTCGAGVISADPGSQTILMTSGTVPAQVGDVPGICTISVNVQGSNGTGTRTNTILPTEVSGTVQSTGAVINPAVGASATLAVRDISIGLVKGFNPLTVFGGSSSTMSVQLINPNTTQLSGIGFTDNMPTGMFLATPVNFSVGTCGGTLSGNPGDGSFTFSGGSLPANSSCTLTLSVTMNVNGNLTNTIPAGAVTTSNGVTNPDPAEATLTNLAGASVSKLFSPNPISVGSYSLLTITIQNTSNVALSGMGLIDTLPGVLPAGIAVAASPAPAPVNNCGGTLSAVSGSQTIQLSNGSLGASISCTMVIAVTGAVPGEYENIIPVGALTNNQNATNTQPAIDTLVINGTTGLAALGNFVWLDADQDGIQDAGELGIDDVTVRLLDQNGVELATTTTDANGFYSFTNLAPGTYRVDFVPPPGYTISPANQGADDAIDSDADVTTGETANVTLTAGETNNTLDAGLFQPAALAALGDFVWLDADQDGIQDAGEAGIPNVTVRLLDQNGVQIATTTTDTNGFYSFTNLVPGTYRVDFLPPPGYAFSPPNQGANDAVDSDADIATGETANVTLAAGETNNTLDAGLFLPSGLGDYVWNDINANGIQEAGEAGIPNVTVRLLDENGVELATTTTDANGFYSFTDLAPGTYRVDFVPPPGYAISPPNQGTNDAVDSDASLTTGETANVTLAAGETNNTLDAGLYQPAALGDFVWLDADQDGIQDAGELGVPNVTVRLLDQNGIELATTTTDANGLYRFTNLAPGTYRVDFVPPADYTVSPPNQGTNDAVDSDASLTTGETANVTLAAGETNNTLDAGLFLQSPGIQVTKSITAVNFVNPNVVQITYSIQVLNSGNVILSNVQVTDDLEAAFPPPASFSVVSLLSSTLSINSGFNGSTVTNLLTGTNTLAPGASGVITLVVQVDTGGVDETYINTAIARGTPPTGPVVEDRSSVPGPSFIDPALTKAVDPALASVGDLVTFTITVFNNGNVPADGVVVTDPLPDNLEYVSATSLDASTLAPRGTVTLIPPRTVQVNIGTVGVNDVILITVIAQVNSQGQPPIQNVASLAANAPPQGVSPDPLPNNSSAVSLQVAGSGGGGGTGGGGDDGSGGGVNTIARLTGPIPVTGFAPGRVTDLSDLPVTRYEAFSDVTLEVPVLKLKMPVVGVPMKDKSWDVNWLLNQAGWLQGSAFPGFSGNSVLTSHVTLPYGQPGPFTSLHKLKTGDKIFVHSYGELFIYEVKSIRELNALDPSILKHEDKPWLTLVTCADYNEKAETYLKRLVVKAELVQVQPTRWRTSPR